MKLSMSKGNWIAFGCGVAVALVGGKVISSRCVRKAAVNVVAKGLQIKDEAQHQICAIKEEAEDIYAEAKQTNDCDCCKAEA